MKPRIVLVVLLLVVFGLPAIGFEQQSELEEAKSLNDQVAKLYQAGRFGEAIPLVQRALTIREKALGPEHADTATSLNSLAELYQRIGTHDKALPLYQRSLTIREKVLGPEHPDTASSLHGLAVLHHDMGAYAQALPLYERALKIYEKVLGPDDETIASVWFHMGLSYRHSRQYQQAIVCFDESYRLTFKRNKRKQMADNQLQLGYCYSALRQSTSALTALRLAVRLYPDEADEAVALFEIGDIYGALEQHETALSYHWRALRIRLRKSVPMTGDVPADILKSVTRLKSTYHLLGQTDKNEKAIIDQATEGMEFERQMNTALSAGLKEYKQDHYRESLGHILDALRIGEKIQETDELTAWILGVAAQVYAKLEQWDDARTLYERQLTLWRRCGTPEELAECLTDLSEVCVKRDAQDRALLYSQEAVRLYRVMETAAKNSKGKWEEYSNTIASHLDRQGEIFRSKKLFQTALAAYEQAYLSRLKIASPNMLNGIPQIVGLYATLGQKKSMQSVFEDGERRLGAESEAKALIARGAEAAQDGKYADAGGFYSQALAICRREKLIEGESAVLINLGALYQSMGENAKALAFFESALRLVKENDFVREIPFCQFNLGEVYRSAGRYEQAITLEVEALKLFREYRMPAETAVCLNGIGFLRYLMGQYDGALESHKEALAVSEASRSIAGIHRSLVLIGFAHLANRDFEESDKAFLRARRLQQGGFETGTASSSAVERSQTITGLNIESLVANTGGVVGMAEVYLAIGAHDKVLSSLEGAQPAWDSDVTSRQEYHTVKGLALRGKGLDREASDELLKAVVLSEATRAGVRDKIGYLGAGYGGGRIRAYRSLTEVLAERALAEVGRVKDALPPAFQPYGSDAGAASFYFAETTKGRSLLEFMADAARTESRADIPEALRQEETSVTSQLAASETQWEQAYRRGGEVWQAHQAKRDALNRQLDALILKLRREHPLYAALHYPRPLPAAELPLRAGEVLLEYALGDEAGYVFVVRKGGVQKLVKIPVGREALEAKVQAFMQPLLNAQGVGFSAAKAKELYDLLLGPAEVKATERIIVVPDGILGLLPFEALVITPGAGERDAVYVGDRYAVSYYQSATVLALQRGLASQPAMRPLFALGNPIFTEQDPRYVANRSGKPVERPVVANAESYAFRGLATRREWGKTSKNDTAGKELVYLPLPETEREVTTVARLLGVASEPPDVLVGVAATETGLRKAPLGDYRYLHFATHADLPGKVQGIKEPFLLLGQVDNQGTDDGLLTMSEVLGLKLRADLVVLSACVTGRGAVMEGEGVANFARAFQHAGARSVVVSLWEVASEPAVEYMTTFYGHLKAGTSRLEALRLARQTLKAKYPNPFYWAVFILHGEG